MRDPAAPGACIASIAPQDVKLKNERANNTSNDNNNNGCRQGGPKRVNPAMRDEQNTLMRTVKKNHNFMLREKGWADRDGFEISLCSESWFSEQCVQFDFLVGGILQ